MNNKQLPPLPTPKFTETIRGVPCITLTEHEHLMRTYALQARAQVQGEPSWWMRETDEGAEWTDTAPLAPDDVVRDAERYRWLADCNNYEAGLALISDPKLTAHALGEKIDAAMLAAKESK